MEEIKLLKIKIKYEDKYKENEIFFLHNHNSLNTAVHNVTREVFLRFSLLEFAKM